MNTKRPQQQSPERRHSYTVVSGNNLMEAVGKDGAPKKRSLSYRLHDALNVPLVGADAPPRVLLCVFSSSGSIYSP
jgi:hypothetical protein